MDRKLMEQMFYEGVMPREQCCPRKKEYHDTMKLCNTLEVEFASRLSPELAQMFQDYKDLFFVKYFSLKKASKFPVFVKGFSLLLAGIDYASRRMRACSIR